MLCKTVDRTCRQQKLGSCFIRMHWSKLCFWIRHFWSNTTLLWFIRPCCKFLMFLKLKMPLRGAWFQPWEDTENETAQLQTPKDGRVWHNLTENLCSFGRRRRRSNVILTFLVVSEILSILSRSPITVVFSAHNSEHFIKKSYHCVFRVHDSDHFVQESYHCDVLGPWFWSFSQGIITVVFREVYVSEHFVKEWYNSLKKMLWIMDYPKHHSHMILSQNAQNHGH